MVYLIHRKLVGIMGYLSFDASVKIHMSGKYTSTKTSKSGSGGLYGYIRHIDRGTDKKNGCEVHHSNENIDSDFTLDNESYYKDASGNWMVTTTSKDMVESVNRRIEYAKKNGARLYNGGKNDTTIVRTLLVQLDEDTIAEHEDTWIEDTISTIEEMFGSDNIVGFSVHRDETSVHMHILFTPVYETTDKQGNIKCSVSQTKFFTSPKSLAGMHKNIRKSLQEKGYEIELENKPIEEHLAGYYDKQGVWHQQGLTPEQLDELSKRKQQLKIGEIDMKLKKEELKKMEQSLREAREKAIAIQQALDKEKDEFEVERTNRTNIILMQRQEIDAKMQEVKQLKSETEDMLSLVYSTAPTCSDILNSNTDEDFLEFCKRYDREHNKRTYDMYHFLYKEFEKEQDKKLSPMERALKEQRDAVASRPRIYGDSYMQNQGNTDSFNRQYM